MNIAGGDTFQIIGIVDFVPMPALHNTKHSHLSCCQLSLGVAVRDYGFPAPEVWRSTSRASNSLVCTANCFSLFITDPILRARRRTSHLYDATDLHAIQSEKLGCINPFPPVSKGTVPINCAPPPNVKYPAFLPAHQIQMQPNKAKNNDPI